MPAALVGVVLSARRRFGGHLVHLGVVLVAFGVIGSSFFQVERVATLAPGETLAVGGYALEYRGLAQRAEPGVEVVYASLLVRRDGQAIASVAPERRIHSGWEDQPVTGVALQTTLPRLDDLYVLLVGWDEGKATLRAFVNPLVSLIWLGGPLFLLGTLVAGWPVRRAATPEVAPHRAPEVVAGEV
jgi:cytochrome c-type biogenesis protein CcmF